MTRQSWLVMPAAFTTLALMACQGPAGEVPAEVVNVPPDACISASKTQCNNSGVFVKREWLQADCDVIPIKGFTFSRCVNTKIFQFSVPGRGSGRVQSYRGTADVAGKSMVVVYSKQTAGNVAGTTHLDEKGLEQRFQPVRGANGEVGRFADDFEDSTVRLSVSHLKVLTHNDDELTYSFDAGPEHCGAFISYGPPEWPGLVRQWGAEGVICDHAGREVSMDEIAQFKSRLVFQ